MNTVHPAEFSVFWRMIRGASELKLYWWAILSLVGGFIGYMEVGVGEEPWMTAIVGYGMAVVILTPIFVIVKIVGWILGKLMGIPKGGSIIDFF